MREQKEEVDWLEILAMVVIVVLVILVTRFVVGTAMIPPSEEMEVSGVVEKIEFSDGTSSTSPKQIVYFNDGKVQVFYGGLTKTVSVGKTNTFVYRLVGEKRRPVIISVKTE